MIYVDTSVVLAHVLSEDSRPPPEFWARGSLLTSRLTEYEAWVRVHAYGLGAEVGEQLSGTLATLDIVELSDGACARCRAPYPVPVRTLDALHLAAADFLRSRGCDIAFATYDLRQRDAAVALGFQSIVL